MKQMCIQVQANSDDKSVSRLIYALMRLPAAKDIHIHKGPVRQEYTNVIVPTSSVRKLWDGLNETIRRDKTLCQNSIVVCEGKNGWDDYELIYHCKSEEIDQDWKLPLKRRRNQLSRSVL
jgi:hypothetical protein